MRACVVGGGPAGIFISKYLADKGIEINLLEKENKLLGNYNYAKQKTDILKNLRNNEKIKVYLNTDHRRIKDEDYDFYVLATGGVQRELDIKGKENLYNSMSLIRGIYNSNEDINNTNLPIIKSIYDKIKLSKCLWPIYDFISLIKNSFDKVKRNQLNLDSNALSPELLKNKKIVIIGMGNVCMDLISYLSGIVKEITVLSRSSFLKAPFDNYLLRELINSKAFELRIEDNFEKPIDRKEERRYKMIKSDGDAYSEIEIVDNKNSTNKKTNNGSSKTLNRINEKPFKPKLNLIFQSTPIEVQKNKILHKVNKSLREECFDFAVNSTGFIPNKIELNTNKKVYSVGWCDKGRGNLGDAKVEAKALADKIISNIQSMK